jgi:protein-disulfide isomerase
MGKKEPGKSKRQLLRTKRRQQEQLSRGLAIGAVALVFVLVAFALIWPSLPKDPGEFVTPVPNPRPMANDNAMGDPKAPITITEYSDFQCPYCGDFVKNTEPLVVESYVRTGKVYFVYRSMDNFVSDNINRGTGDTNTESHNAAMAAYCAGDQNKYWEYHDILFANQKGENIGNLSSTRLNAFAESIGLDMAEFKACVKDKKFEDRLAQDEKDGYAASTGQDGVGTPFFVVSYTIAGQEKQVYISGAQPFSEFQRVIEAALAELGL